MKVIINNEKTFRKKNGYLKKAVLDKSMLDKEYDVYAIIKFRRQECYLLLVNNSLEYVDVDSVFVVDESISDNWIYRKFKKGYKIEYNSGIFGEYGYILIKNYMGPSAFINDRFFLINILYEPGVANRFFYENYIKKDKK